MVRIENEKLIIEIQTPSPISELSDIQEGLLSVIQHYSSQNENDPCVYNLGNLLRELLPTHEQNQQIFSSSIN